MTLKASVKATLGSITGINRIEPSSRGGMNSLPILFATKTFAIGASVVMAITLVPILCTFLLKGKLRPMEENFSSRMLLNGYQPVLRWVLDHKKTFLAIPLAIVVSSVFVAKRIGREFMPPLDEGSILFMPVMLPSVALTDAFRVMQKQDMIIKSFPEIDMAVGKLGGAHSLKICIRSSFYAILPLVLG